MLTMTVNWGHVLDSGQMSNLPNASDTDHSANKHLVLNTVPGGNTDRWCKFSSTDWTSKLSVFYSHVSQEWYCYRLHIVRGDAICQWTYLSVSHTLSVSSTCQKISKRRLQQFVVVVFVVTVVALFILFCFVYLFVWVFCFVLFCFVLFDC